MSGEPFLPPEVDQIIHSKRKTISLEVNREGSLIVRAPMLVTQAQITALVKQKERWIRAKQELAHLRRLEDPAKGFIAGEEFLYLGESYPLVIVPDQNSPLDLRDKFYLARHALSEAKQVFVGWYKERALQVLQERVAHFAKDNGFQYGHSRITNARTRWGSCGRKGSLNFSWRLVMAPIEVIDYVAVHELVHLQIRSHSKDFWRKVNALLPDYRQRKEWLRDNGHRLTLD